MVLLLKGVANCAGLGPQLARTTVSFLPLHLISSKRYSSSTMSGITVNDSWVLADDGTPFYTKEVSPLPFLTINQADNPVETIRYSQSARSFRTW